MMTEDEARTKWCPLTHTQIIVMMPKGSTFPANETAILGRYNCIASGCMAWRDPGYCGLAGDPYPVFVIPEDKK